MLDYRETLEVRLDAFRIDADVGIHRHEIGARQPLIITAALTLKAAAIERLDDTVDYRAIAAIAQRLSESHIPLIENFARTMAERCLVLGPVAQVAITVEKPQAVPGGLAGVRVILRGHPG